MVSTRKTGLLAAVVLTGICMAAAFAPRREKGPLHWHESASFPHRGRPTRVKLLIPTGWAPVKEASPAGTDNYTIVLKPPQRFLPWLPSWARRWFGGPVRKVDPKDELSVFVGETIAPFESGVIQLQEEWAWNWWSRGQKNGTDSPVISTTAWRRVPDFAAVVYYTRADRAEFDATHVQVCESLEIIR
jgi:hypothetical protein